MTIEEKPVFPKSDDEPLVSILVLYDNGNMFYIDRVRTVFLMI